MLLGFNAQPDSLKRALEAALSAVKLDRHLVTGHYAVALVRFNNGELEAFRAAADRALELSPNNAQILADIGTQMVLMGELDRGAAMVEKAIVMNPDHPIWYHYSLAIYYRVKGDYDTFGRVFGRRCRVHRSQPCLSSPLKKALLTGFHSTAKPYDVAQRRVASMEGGLRSPLILRARRSKIAVWTISVTRPAHEGGFAILRDDEDHPSDRLGRTASSWRNKHRKYSHIRFLSSRRIVARPWSAIRRSSESGSPDLVRIVHVLAPAQPCPAHAAAIEVVRKGALDDLGAQLEGFLGHAR